jgi:DNA-3-methyladenine glycosylase
VTGPGRGRPPPRIEGAPFDRALLAAPSLVAAQSLLGARLVRDDPAGLTPRRVGRIVEVEAYIGEEDRASHARMGRTTRNEVMFGSPGVAYVYLVYGMHHCLNVVTEAAPRPAALLVRAVEPLAGLEAMRTARTVLAVRAGRAAVRVADERLAAGPGLVCAAFGIDRTATGLDLCDPSSPLRLEAHPDDEAAPLVEATPRIGIGYAGEPWTSRPWRLVVAGSASLSRPGH